MEMTIHIEADKLAAAIHELAAALQGKNLQKPVNAKPANGSVDDDYEEIYPGPAPTASIPTAPAQAVPVPTAPTQQQPAPMQAPIATAAPAPTVPPVAPAAPSTPVPTTTQTYTLDQLARAATQLRDAGKLQQIQQLMQQFGVRALQELPSARYGEFATALRGMGAQI